MPTEDVREVRLPEIYSILTSYACSHAYDLSYLGVEPLDFVQDVIHNIFRRQGLNKYDESKCQSFEALVRFCGFSHLTDLKKRKFGAKSRLTPEGKPYSFVSMETPLGDSQEEGSFTVADTIPEESSPEVLLVELSMAVPDTQISPNYSLSWRELFSRSYRESPQDIARSLGISESRIQQLQSQIRERYLPESGFRSRGRFSVRGKMQSAENPTWEEIAASKKKAVREVSRRS